MNTLILYRSYYGNTKQVAEAIARQMQSNGHAAAVQDVRSRLPGLDGIDAAIVGAPTRMGRVARRARIVMRHLRRKGFGDKPIAVFDTIAKLPTSPEELAEMKRWVDPGAVGRLHTAAVQQGLNVFSETLRCEVTGAKGPLADNALEKAAAFAVSFLSFAQHA
jgi:multimeric flavodoxin WrbA